MIEPRVMPSILARVTALLTRPAVGNPVQLVSVPEPGVPRAGVTRVGVSANTASPVPVSSVRAERRLALDDVPKNVATPVARLVIPVPPRPTARVPAPNAEVLSVPPLLDAAWAWLAFAQLVEPMVGLAVHAGSPDANSRTLPSVALARFLSTVVDEAYRMSPAA